MLAALLLLAAAPNTVAGLPVGYAEALCDIGARAHADGDATFFRRAFVELGVPMESRPVLLGYCLGRSTEKLRALESRPRR